MGSGTDVAMESASVTLLRGDVQGIVRARDPSREARHSIKQNPIFACFYNAAGVSDSSPEIRPHPRQLAEQRPTPVLHRLAPSLLNAERKTYSSYCALVTDDGSSHHPYPNGSRVTTVRSTPPPAPTMRSKCGGKHDRFPYPASALGARAAGAR